MNLTYSAYLKIPLDTKIWDRLKDAFQTFNQTSSVQLDISSVKLEYQNIIHSMNNESFNRGKKVIGFPKALEILQFDKARLLLDKAELQDVQFQLHDDNMLLLLEDIYANINTNTDDYFHATEGLELLFALISEFGGNILINHRLNDDDDSRFVAFQSNNELHNIEGNANLCNDLYDEYKIDMLYPEINNQLLFISNIKKINDTLTSDNPFLSYLLSLTSQNGCRILLEEHNKRSRINFTLEGMKMSEILARLFRTDEIEEYNQRREDLISKYTLLKEMKYAEYASFQMNTIQDFKYNSLFNTKELFNSLNMRNYLVNVEQKNDDISIQLYDLVS